MVLELLFYLSICIIIVHILLKNAKLHTYVSRWVDISPAPPKNITVVDTYEDCVYAVNLLYSKIQKYHVLGFDCEWVTNGRERKPIALLQLAAPDGFCVLLRLVKFAKYGIPDHLKLLLSNFEILKVGVAPSDDAKYLYQDYGIVVHGCLDLRHLIVRNDGIPLGGLSGLAYRILGVKMDKAFTVTCSDWEADELTERQILYAANDALVAVNIFKVVASGQSTYREYRTFEWFKLLRSVFSCNLLRNENLVPQIQLYIDELYLMNHGDEIETFTFL